MRITYVDESGVSNPAQEPYLVVAGVIVHGDHQLEKLETELELILERRVPEKYRDGLVFHAGDIYGGNGKIFDKRRNPEWTADKRMPILADLALLPAKLNLWIVSAHIKRDEFPHQEIWPELKNATQAAHCAAYVACLLQIDQWMRQHAKREHCLLIVEDVQKTKTLIKQIQLGYQDRKYGKALGNEFVDLFPLTKIKEDPAFQEKKQSHPLIMADFVAFVTKRAFMGDRQILAFYEPWMRRDVSRVTVIAKR